MIRYVAFADGHLEALCRLAVREGWDSFADPETARRALTAPGGLVLVALAADEPIGFIQLQTDRSIHAHVSNILVAPAYRRTGVGRALIERAFARSGAKYVDLVSTEGSDAFYRSFAHQEYPGFRIYPGVPRAPPAPIGTDESQAGATD